MTLTKAAVNAWKAGFPELAWLLFKQMECTSRTTKPAFMDLFQDLYGTVQNH